MQIFVTGTVFETIEALDKKRFHNQITEARIVIECLRGKNGWGKHPLIKMYTDYEDWLMCYIEAFKAYKSGEVEAAKIISRIAELYQPDWFNEEFYNKHRARLYTKNPKEYSQWAHLGESYSNWYRVGGVWKEYKQK